MAQEIAAAYVTIYPKTTGFGKAIGEAIGASSKSSSVRTSSLALGSTIGNLAATGLSKVSSVIAGSLGAAIGRVDTLEGFSTVMANLGYDAQEASEAIGQISERLLGLPTTTDFLVGMTQQLAAITGNLTDATELSLAFNDAMVAAGADANDTSRAFLQYSQMLARGKVDASSWYALQETMPGQLAQIAQAMLGAGATSTDLYDAMRDGIVTFDDFNETLLRLDKEGMAGFASFSDAAHEGAGGIATSMTNLNTAVTRGVANIIAAFGSDNIIWAIETMKSGINSAFAAIVPAFEMLGNKFRELRENFDGVALSFGSIDHWRAATNLNILTIRVNELAGALSEKLNVPLIGAVSLSMQVWGERIARVSGFSESLSKSLGALSEKLAPMAGRLGSVSGAVGGLSKIVNVLNPVALVISSMITMIATSDSYRESVIGVVKQIGAGLLPILGKLGAGLLQIGSVIMPLLLKVSEELTPIFAQIGLVIMQLVAAILPAISGALTALMPAIVNIVEAVSNLIYALLPVVVSVLDVIISVIQALMPTITAVFNIVVNVVTTVVGLIANLISIIINIAATVASVVGAVIASIAEVFGVIAEFIAVVIDAVAGFFEGIIVAVDSAIQLIVGAIAAFLNNIVQAVTEAFDNVVQTFQDMFDGAHQIVSNMVETVGGFFEDMVESITLTVSGILGAIQSGFQPAIDFITGLADTAVSWGSDIIDGIVEGITGAIGRIASAASDVAGTIASYIHFSEPDVGPLSNFHTYMPDMTKQLVDGMRNGISDVRDTANELARAIDFRGDLSWSDGGGGNIIIQNMTVNADDADSADKFVAMIRRATVAYA